MENKIDLKKLIVDLAEKLKFSDRLLEKDYHLTKILHKISKKRIKDLVFKGGTCLNKCYLGFYRLSEDLDFVYNKDTKEMSKRQIKMILDKLRRELIEILDKLGLETSKELGKGWKMLTSKFKPRIVGLEIITKYNSIIDNSVQTIKLEISFRKKLRKPTKRKTIKHEFIDALGQPILEKDIEIEVIDLTENLAEKFRALLVRKNIAIRDIYDIYFILKNKIAKIDKVLIDLILAKINESSKEKFTRKELFDFIKNLDSKLSDLNEKEISSMLKSDESVNVKEM
ncbi:MAG TPA: nucleotidyl transferase AbiEii/AbiGii toxin family protein, partial [Candidatus Pacearchaeota archaeon]|nr:nucleotidyl transferase AbiEii/AbiGii toxin family protein [Candidatus Pacearchaeota archaeon]